MRKLIDQFGGRLQPISPDPAKHTVTPKVDKMASGIVKRQPCGKLNMITFNPNPPGGGKPQVDENTMEALRADFYVVCGLWQALVVEKRVSKLGGRDSRLVSVYSEDKSIHEAINTTTSRPTHLQPTLAAPLAYKR